MNKSVEKLKVILGDRLVSLTSFKRGDAQECVLVVKDYDYSESKKLGKAMGKTPTIIFDEEDFKNGVDVFPVDIVLIGQSKKILAGVDLLDKIEVNKKDLRHHLEYLLRSQRIYLKTETMNFGSKRVIKGAFKAVLPVLIAVVYFKTGERANSTNLAKKLSQAYNLDTEVLELIKDKSNNPDTDLSALEVLLSEIINKIN